MKKKKKTFPKSSVCVCAIHHVTNKARYMNNIPTMQQMYRKLCCWSFKLPRQPVNAPSHAISVPIDAQKRPNGI